MLRGRGGCYKHTFYGIVSYQCMEATPSLACANKCIFCWRHHDNPVGTSFRWQVRIVVRVVSIAARAFATRSTCRVFPEASHHVTGCRESSRVGRPSGPHLLCWQVNDPNELIHGFEEKHLAMVKAMRGVPGVLPERFAEASKSVKHCALSLVCPRLPPHVMEVATACHRWASQSSTHASTSCSRACTAR